MMKTTSKEQATAWLKSWKLAGERMEKLRENDIRHADTAQSLIMLSGAFEHARISMPMRRTSGLIEQQRFFKKLADRSGK